MSLTDQINKKIGITMSGITQLLQRSALPERKLTAHSRLLFLSHEAVGGIY